MNVCLKHRNALEGNLVWLATCVSVAVRHKVVMSPQMCVQLCADHEVNKHDGMLPSCKHITADHGRESLKHATCLLHLPCVASLLCNNAFQKGVDKVLTVYSLATSCKASFPMSCTGISSSAPSQIVRRSAGRVSNTANTGSGTVVKSSCLYKSKAVTGTKLMNRKGTC